MTLLWVFHRIDLLAIVIWGVGIVILLIILGDDHPDGQSLEKLFLED